MTASDNRRRALDSENVHVLKLVQAMLGSVTPHFRAVAIRCEQNKIALYFVLDEDDPESREEIEEIRCEFDALQEDLIDLSVEVIIDKGPLEALDLPRRVFTRWQRRLEDAGGGDSSAIGGPAGPGGDG